MQPGKECELRKAPFFLAQPFHGTVARDWLGHRIYFQGTPSAGLLGNPRPKAATNPVAMNRARANIGINSPPAQPRAQPARRLPASKPTALVKASKPWALA